MFLLDVGLSEYFVWLSWKEEGVGCVCGGVWLLLYRCAWRAKRTIIESKECQFKREPRKLFSFYMKVFVCARHFHK